MLSISCIYHEFRLPWSGFVRLIHHTDTCAESGQILSISDMWHEFRLSWCNFVRLSHHSGTRTGRIQILRLPCIMNLAYPGLVLLSPYIGLKYHCFLEHFPLFPGILSDRT